MLQKCKPLNCDVHHRLCRSCNFYPEDKGKDKVTLEMSEAAPYITHCYNQKNPSVYNRDHHENLSGSYTIPFLAII
jgi:hypothetical protein